MSDFDYSIMTISVLAQEIEEEQSRVNNLKKAISDLPEAEERLQSLKDALIAKIAPAKDLNGNLSVTGTAASPKPSQEAEGDAPGIQALEQALDIGAYHGRFKTMG